ncbi:NAD-dependent epimerase/dehydratase family protein [Chloroflexota bacterium]
MAKRKVVVVGASGRMAALVLPAFRERYDLTLLDIKNTDAEGNAIPDVQICDVLDPDRNTYRPYFEGVDAVVNFGWIAGDRNDPDEYFRAEMASIQIAHNVYQTALETGAKRVVNTSSNHAADYYEALILDGQWDGVKPGDLARSDNYYGWAKDVYEHLGFVFACGKVYGTPLENVQIRIGGPRETDVANCESGNLRCMRRALAVYLSQRDMVQLYVKSIEAPDIRDEFGVPFQIFYGISDNPHAFWSIANARCVIGYEPQDNSEIRFADLIAAHIRAATEC